MFGAYQGLLEVEVYAQNLNRPLRGVTLKVSDIHGYCLFTSLQGQNAWTLQSK